MIHLRTTAALFGAILLAAPGAANAEMKLVVAMPTTPPNIVHMPIHIARDLGLYKKEGLVVDTVQLEGGVKTYRAMVAGNAEIASASGPFSIVGLAKGAPTKVILAFAPKLEASMVVNKDIKSMADLKGKRIGIQQPGGFADVLARGRAARRQDRSQGRPFRQHRFRGRAGAARQPGRHRHFACRTGDRGPEQDSEPARHRAACGKSSPRICST